MPTVYPLNYQPDGELNWSVNPGVCSAMSYFTQTQTGRLAGVKTNNSAAGFALTGSDAVHAEVFAQVNGSARLLVFRKQNIDEYTSAGSRTNRGTGYNASTVDWSATAWGNQIIACNYLDATQSSTGAGFSALGGSSPKARYIASNINFVMMADVDDGGSNVYSDMVWWCGIRDPSTWTPSQATQAGRIRLLDTPGPIKQIVAFGDKFVAFKENSIYVGQYVGPPYVFAWKCVVANIGLSYSAKAVTECDGKLYFYHISGVYSYDGQQFKNIGYGMNGTFIGVAGTSTGASAGSCIKMRGDDIEGNVWLCGYNAFNGAGTRYQMYAYSYNVRTGLWAMTGFVCQSDVSVTNPPPPIVYGSTAEYRAFNSTWAVFTGFTYIDNASSPTLSMLTGGAILNDGSSLTTGYIGSNRESGRTIRVYPRIVQGTSASTLIASGTLTAYHDEISNPGDGTATLTWNYLTGTLDGRLSAKYQSVALTVTSGKVIVMAGLGIDIQPAGAV